MNVALFLIGAALVAGGVAGIAASRGRAGAGLGRIGKRTGPAPVTGQGTALVGSLPQGPGPRPEDAASPLGPAFAGSGRYYIPRAGRRLWSALVLFVIAATIGALLGLSVYGAVHVMRHQISQLTSPSP